MKAHKLVIYVLDMDNLGKDDVSKMIESQKYPNYCLNPHVVSVETADVGDWTDEHPLNKHATFLDEFNRIFKGNK